MVKVGKLYQSCIMKRYQDISAHSEGFPRHVASYVLHQVLLAQKKCGKWKGIVKMGMHQVQDFCL